MRLCSILLLPLLGAALCLLPHNARGATSPPPAAFKLGTRTNLPAALRLASRTNAAPAVAPATARTNAVTGPSRSGTNTNPALMDRLKQLPSHRAFYPVVAGLALCLGAFFLYRALQGGAGKAGKTAPVLTPSKVTSKVPGAKAQLGTVHSCNVLEVGTQARQVWQFDARGRGFVLGREQTCLEGESLPARLIAKDWRALFQTKLNIAWLPPENVFLRVVQLPRSDFDETLSMVELQLEKLSPIPVTQAVWSLHILPHIEGALQTVIVMIVARDAIEDYLGRLEGQGYLADRLELPLIDQLQADAITEDGAWIYPGAIGGKNTALVAWWYGGVLRNLDFLTLPATNRAASLREQLLQMAWAGELEGWLTSPPEWHLVADVATGEWEPVLREGLEQPIEILPPLAPRQLAALTARRSAQSEPRANLLPIEFATRYHQQFVDRLWMRGLLAVGVVYLLYVAGYMARLSYATYGTQAKEAEVALLGPTYTNAIQLRDRYKVLKERQELKYAALDCWDTTARLLPENVTLTSINFSEGRLLHLSGNAPADQTQKLLNFERDIRRASVNGQPLFDSAKGDSIQWRMQGPIVTWSLALELKRVEVQ
jgi:hypothetical protein